jgi:hypothetical protein
VAGGTVGVDDGGVVEGVFAGKGRGLADGRFLRSPRGGELWGRYEDVR